MRVLFFVEAYPLRNRLTGHLWLLGELRNLFSKSADAPPDPDIRLFCGALARDKMAMDGAAVMPSVIPFSPELNEQFFARSNLWRSPGTNGVQPAGVEAWLDYVSGDAAELGNILHGELKRIKESVFDFDVVVYWGANGLLENHVLAQVLPGVRSVAIEMGPTRPPFVPTLAMDTHGVNGKSLMAGLTSADLIKLKNDAPTRLRTENAVLMESGRTLFQSRPSRLSNGLAETLISLKRDYEKLVLFPHQLADDANSLIFNNGIDTFSALKKICDHTSMTNGLVVLKPHPKCMNNAYNARAWRALKSDVETHLGDKVMIWDHPVELSDYTAFLESFDAVIGINSSVLFEAALLDRPVAPLGKTGFFPGDADDWFEAALTDWSGKPAQAARVSVTLNVAYLLPPRGILKDRRAFLAAVGMFAQAFDAKPRTTLRKVIEIQKRLSIRDRHLVHWQGPNIFNARGIFGLPKPGVPVNVITHRNGFIHNSFSVVHEVEPGIESLVGGIDRFEIADSQLHMKVYAVTDLGEPPFAFMFKSGGKVLAWRSTEARPARAAAQGFPSNTRIGATLSLAINSDEFPLYGNFSLLAVTTTGVATTIHVPSDMRRSVVKAILGGAALDIWDDDQIVAEDSDLAVIALNNEDVGGGSPESVDHFEPQVVEQGEVVVVTHINSPAREDAVDDVALSVANKILPAEAAARPTDTKRSTRLLEPGVEAD